MNPAAAFAAALLVSVAFCQTAAGQTHTAIAVFPGPPGNVSASPPSCNATFCKSISRYTNTFILGITEYNTSTCQFISAGQWSAGTNIQPTNNGTPAGTVDVSQPPFQGPIPPGCTASGGPYYYAPIYFQWTLRKNLTIPALINMGFDPTATFNSTWSTPDGQFNENFLFEISVPVVRPMSETTEWSGFTGPVGKWQQTLVPSPGDAPFDFSGESVRERFVNVAPGCSTPNFKAGTQGASTNLGSSWAVKPKNQWGPDGVGFGSEADSVCAMQYARCVKPTGCLNSAIQQMSIRSPADKGYANYGNLNVLVWGLTGRVIFTGQGLGFVLSARAGKGPESEYYVTQPYYCASYLLKQFPKCK